MDRSPARMLVTLIGDIENEPFARVKYGGLIHALMRKYSLAVCDATLRGVPRFVNALETFSPNRKVWKERFYQNTRAFKARSKVVARALRKQGGDIDLIFQIGVLYDVDWKKSGTPYVIYTDYTSTLASRKPDLGRSPQKGTELLEWIALERNAYQRAMHIFTRGEFVRASLIDDYHIPAERVTTIGGGVNLEPLPAVRAQKERDFPTVLFIGKEFHRKGGELLLRAFHEARKIIPDARLMMVTDGPLPKDIPIENVEFFAPSWDRDFIGSLYERADCFVLPSRLETWGDVLLEAMAYGLPCIGVTGEAMGDIIDHHKTGLLIPPENVEELTRALIDLLTHEDFRKQYGAAGRQRVENYFTWDQVVARIYPIIQTTINS